MDYFILIVLFFIILFVVFYHYQTKICKILNAPVVYPPLDNALRSARAIGSFLSDRYKATGGSTLVPKGETGINEHRMQSIMLGNEMAIAEFIRLCHSVGCEVVVRQIGVDDLEDRENTPEVFAQEMSRMEDEYWDDVDRRQGTGRYRFGVIGSIPKEAYLLFHS